MIAVIRRLMALCADGHRELKANPIARRMYSTPQGQQVMGGMVLDLFGCTACGSTFSVLVNDDNDRGM